jgi:putative membrane protein
MKLIKFFIIPIFAGINLCLLDAPDKKDRKFLFKAIEASESEITFGKLADVKSLTDSVRYMAALTVKEHKAAKDDLMALSDKLKLKLPLHMDSEHLEKLTAIKKLAGKSFDAFYLNEQNLEHQQLTALYEIEIREGTDSLVIQYAKKHLPALKTNLKMFHKATNGLLLSANSSAR